MASNRCSVVGCETVEQTRRGMCNTHYRRFMIHGDATIVTIRRPGEGTPHIDGYWMHEIDGRAVLRHVLIAEKALGHRLPKGAQVHHVDQNRSNDSPSNLVICPSAAYHQLLHKRQTAMDACGHADWIQCSICKQYSAPDQVKVYRPSGNKWHVACRRANPIRRKNGVQLQTSR